jgi:hypothetical protein
LNTSPSTSTINSVGKSVGRLTGAIGFTTGAVTCPLGSPRLRGFPGIRILSKRSSSDRSGPIS